VERAARNRETERRMLTFEVDNRNVAALLKEKSRVTIGRGADNDVVFDSRVVSKNHAVIERTNETYKIRDLHSSNGTYVNGNRVRESEIRDGDEVWIGDQAIIFDRTSIAQVTQPLGIRVDISNVSKTVKGGKVILHDVTLSILPGEFVAIVGGSGAGKSTLMDAISGVRPATGGRVYYNGRDYYQEIALFRNVLGYVPQDDIIHTELPLRTTLRYSAKLRLPADTTKPELEGAVDQAIAELGLTNQVDIKVSALSGGQRKRCSIGVELLTRPKIFFLDEPTSGLDPATDLQMMELVRRLADEGATVFLTTHATKNVMLCDKIIFLARGGHLAYYGPPRQALEYFGAQEFDQIYVKLADELTPEEWAQRFRNSPEYAAALAETAQPQQQVQPSTPAGEDRSSLVTAKRAGGPRRALQQFAVLAQRNFQIYKDPARFMPLLMQPVIMTVLLLVLFEADIFEPSGEISTAPTALLFTLCFLTFNFGLLYGITTISAEMAIFRRERMVNLGTGPYLFSKTSFLGPLLLAAVVFMTAALWALGRLPDEGFDVYGPLLLTLFLIAATGLCCALFTSAALDRPTDVIPFWILPQVLFSGGLVAVSAMNSAGEAVSLVTLMRYGFEAAAKSVDLLALFQASTNPTALSLIAQYEDAFSGGVGASWLFLSIFIVLPLVLAYVILRRRSAMR
jgi:ABC-type multidrug transport system ATPase subunit